MSNVRPTHKCNPQGPHGPRHIGEQHQRNKSPSERPAWFDPAITAVLDQAQLCSTSSAGRGFLQDSQYKQVDSSIVDRAIMPSAILPTGSE
jgi:hypothetical protein